MLKRPECQSTSVIADMTNRHDAAPSPRWPPCCYTASPVRAICIANRCRCWPGAFTSSPRICRALAFSPATACGIRLHVRQSRQGDRRFTEVVGLERYALYVLDYGAPTGFRMAMTHPERITAIISQNGNAYGQGCNLNMTRKRLGTGFSGKVCIHPKPGGEGQPAIGDVRKRRDLGAWCAGCGARHQRRASDC